MIFVSGKRFTQLSNSVAGGLISRTVNLTGHGGVFITGKKRIEIGFSGIG